MGATCQRFALPLFAALLGHSVVGNAQTARRPVTIADSIGMNVAGESNDPVRGIPPVVFSPDRKHFVLVIHRGNLQSNTNDYHLLLFATADALHSPQPKTLVTLSSGTNEPAISAVRWLPNNKTILFIGSERGSPNRVYSVDIATATRKEMTKHPTDILAFDASGDAAVIAYLARPPERGIITDRERRFGVVVENQNPSDLLVGHDTPNPILNPPSLFIQRGQSPVRRIGLPHDEQLNPLAGLSVSRDGRYVVVATGTDPRAIPSAWKQYAGMEHVSFYSSYRVIETATGKLTRLIDAPSIRTSILGWNRDNTAVLVTTRLPLGIDDPEERSVREKQSFIVEASVTSRSITRITDDNHLPILWDWRTDTLVLTPQLDSYMRNLGSGDALEAFRKHGDAWRPIPSAKELVEAADGPIHVELVQDMNTPPHLAAEDLRTHVRRELMDLNPQFRSLAFGKVEVITWKGTNGQSGNGGLYFPRNYSSGRKYPLVIQTRGWDPKQFQIDGYSTAAYAAQELASADIVVAEVDRAEKFGAGEGAENSALFEGLIDQLDRRGLIDRSRVGLQGWSRGGVSARHALAFSKYHFAAAVLADAMDAGYVNYATWLGRSSILKTFSDVKGGAPPFGPGLLEWFKNSPAFNLEQVHTPLLLFGFGNGGLLEQREWFVGLRHLGKPVEMIWLPESHHWPIKPLERLTVQGGTVDWFRFWLQGYEDPDTAKKEQYVRWRELRRQQDASATSAGPAPIEEQLD